MGWKLARGAFPLRQMPPYRVMAVLTAWRCCTAARSIRPVVANSELTGDLIASGTDAVSGAG
tara:strand:- start:3122 stop:3307 length:186 start_codon:yes stop_codon:yes gene_type:complete